MEPPKAKKRKKGDRERDKNWAGRKKCMCPSHCMSHPIIYNKIVYVHEDITSHYQHCFARPTTLYKRFLVLVFFYMKSQALVFSFISQFLLPHKKSGSGYKALKLITLAVSDHEGTILE